MFQNSTNVHFNLYFPISYKEFFNGPKDKLPGVFEEEFSEDEPSRG